MGLFLFVLISCVYLAPGQSFSKGLHRFIMQYAAVQYNLKGEQGYFDQYMELFRLNHEAANFIGAFWYKKARVFYSREIDQIFKQTVVVMDGKTEEEKAVIQEIAQSKVDDLCFIFYYDHWDEINKAILTKYEFEKKREKNK